MNELGHGLSISKPSLEENVKTKSVSKSFQKEMRNFQKHGLHLCSPNPNDIFKAQTSPLTTSFPTAYLIETPLNRAYLLSLQFPVPSFKFLFFTSAYFILTIYNPISSSIKYIPNILSFGPGAV